MGLLSRLAENRNQAEENQRPAEIPDNYNDEFKSFEFEGNKYYVVIRDNILIFDGNMMLIHTLSRVDIVSSELPLIKKAGEVIANNDTATVKLFVKRNGSFERLSFHNAFDATFIFKKLRRVAARPDETIEEIFIEDNGAIVERYVVNHWQRRFTRNVFKRKRETDTVMKIADVEDEIDAVISELVAGNASEIDPEKIDKCIELLQEQKK